MQTKLVYVLTCEEDDTYIEQALISIWSARYHNPQSIIILIVDDLTRKLLVGMRAEVLKYVTDCIVIDLPLEMRMRERSRYIKTSVRKIIKGDFLFIDTDTIICRSLAEVDNLSIEIGAVLDSHLYVTEYPEYLYSFLKSRLDKIDVDISFVKSYFSSGVMYVKDTLMTHKLYELWHQNWREGLSNGFIGDQPYLLKSDQILGGVITEISRNWNTVMYTYPKWIKQAYILHFSPHKNMSFIFDTNFLKLLRNEGLDNYKEIIVKHQLTYIAHIWQNPFKSYINMYYGFKLIEKYSPLSLSTYLINTHRQDLIKVCVLEMKLYFLAPILVFIFDIWYSLKKMMKLKLKL